MVCVCLFCVSLIEWKMPARIRQLSHYDHNWMLEQDGCIYSTRINKQIYVYNIVVAIAFDYFWLSFAWTSWSDKEIECCVHTVNWTLSPMNFRKEFYNVSRSFHSFEYCCHFALWFSFAREWFFFSFNISSTFYEYDQRQIKTKYK